jgi:protein TonB
MFSTLLESKRVRQKSTMSTVLSAIFHGLAVAGVVYATAKEYIKEEQIDEEANFVQVEQKPPEPPPPEVEVVKQEMKTDAPPPKGFQTLTAPIEIPTVIPEIDLTAKVTNELDFSGVGVKGGIAAGIEGQKGVVSEQSYYQFEVEKVARMAPGNAPPLYPNILRATNQVGKVMISFVIDTSGKADMSTFKVVEATNTLFVEEVKKVLPKYNFIPAEIGSRKVRMHVQLPFDFVLNKGGDED